jgi:hypothetical protein
MKKITDSTKNFVRRHKGTIVVGTIATLTSVVIIQQLGIRSLNAFLQEHDLLDEYYYIEETEI